MAYTTITDGTVDLASPVVEEVMFALRDNPIAMFAGDTGAPRLAVKALERVAAGSQIRIRRDTDTISSASLTAQSWAVGFFQIGTVRVEATYTSASGSPTFRIKRKRAGTSTTLLTESLSAGTTKTLDVSILPFDQIIIEITAASGATATLDNMRFSTNGENLWTDAMGYSEGNDYA